MIYYAGIGSRESPEDVLELMRDIGKYFAVRGWCLRSGGAPGADLAFEDGCIGVNGSKQIFHPWKNFNKRYSEFYEPPLEAYGLAESVHPGWKNCKQGAQRLLARNAQQLLGPNLDDPSSIVICWTLGLGAGGTMIAVHLAERRGIPVLNLYNWQDWKSMNSVENKFERVMLVWEKAQQLIGVK